MRISTLCVVTFVLSTDVGAQENGYEYRDEVTVERAVADVMARPEFQKLVDIDEDPSSNPAWLDGILDWLAEWFDGAERQESGGFSVGLANLAYVLAFVIVVAALAFILKAVLDNRTHRRLETERTDARVRRAPAAPGETPPDEFWARALALAKEGNERLAIRELLHGAMSSLERQGRIRYRRGLTNRDYLWAAPRETRSALRTIIATFERVYFGRRTATAEGFLECAEAYRAGFGSAHPDADVG